nr:uncharacterized protein LOC126516939 [Dermacentor andersoni]
MAPRLTVDQRKAITEMGRTQRAQATGRPLATVNRVLQAFHKEGRLKDAARGRPPRATTEEEDRLVVAGAADDPFLSARELRDMFALNASTQTIRSRLHAAGVKSRIAAQKTQLRQADRDTRLEFVSVVEDWTPDNWRAVVFSDEATFCTRWDQQKRVWRPEKARDEEKYTWNVRSSGRVSVSVWGAISYDGLGPLYRIPGRMTAEVYAEVDVQSGVQYTFGELLDGCRRIAAGLRRLGLRTGDNVGFHCVNSYEFMVTMCGTFFAGGIANMIKTNHTHGEIQRQLIASQPIFVVCDRKDAEKVKKACKGIASVKSVIVTTGTYEGTRMLSELTQSSSMGGFEAPLNLNPDAVLAIIYSSGSTGLPKGVQLTHRNIIAQVILCRAHLLGARPPANVGVTERTIAEKDESERGARPGMKVARRIVEEEGLPHRDVQALPSGRFAGLLDGPDLVSERGAVQGIGPYRLYGMTELTGGTTLSAPQVDDVKSVGRPLPFNEVKVVHPESRQTLGPYEQGEICMRGPTAFKGYLKNEIKTAEAYENGFVRSGDIGYYSTDGRIFVCGRLKELIKCMDQQVAPAELEELLAADPDVLQVIVVGVPHPQYGEAPRAFVVSRHRLPGPDEEEREADRLKELVAANFAHHKHLHGGVQFLAGMPQTGSYKDSRRALKELYIQQNRCANKRC